MSDFRKKVCKILDHCKKVFAIDVVFVSLQGNNPRRFKMRGIFDNEFELVDPDTEILISTCAPRLGVKLKDFKVKPRKRDLFEIKDELDDLATYVVIDVQEDGQGGATIILHKEII